MTLARTLPAAPDLKTSDQAGLVRHSRQRGLRRVLGLVLATLPAGALVIPDDADVMRAAHLTQIANGVGL